MRAVLVSVLALSTVLSVCAKTIVVTVGGGSNTTQDASAVFKPQTVVAARGDLVFFNFTQGNHTAIQSTFASPCVPAHFTNQTINGFNSGFRDTVNGTAITNLQVVIDKPEEPIWFFDWGTCEKGGVGAINVNQSSWETFDGFVRNAERLNGTSSSSAGAGSPTQYPGGPNSASVTQPSVTLAPSETASSSATRSVTFGASFLVSALAALATISF